MGVVLTRLERPDAAAAAFRWVVERGPDGREEVRVARQWLAETAGAEKSGAEGPGPDAATDDVGTGSSSPHEMLGRLEGQTRWTRLQRGHTAPRLKILLIGDDQGTRGRRYAARTVLNQSYRFEGIEPGTYRLVAQAGMVRLWDMPVTVRSGEPTRLDLTEATAAAPADALLAPAS